MRIVQNGDFSENQKSLQNPLRCTEKHCAQYVAVDPGSVLVMLIYFVAGIFIAKQERILESNKKIT